MLWLLFPVGAIAYAGYKALSKSDVPKRRVHPRPPAPSVLELNLMRLKRELAALGSTPRVALLGQPGAGKSSLLWSVTDGKCVPRPLIGVQTDTTDWSRSTDINLIHSAGTASFVDAPGQGTERHPLAVFVKAFPFHEFRMLMFVWNGKVRADDAGLLRALHRTRPHVHMHPMPSLRVLFVRTFSDAIDAEGREGIRQDWREHFPGHDEDALHFVSNRTRDGIPELKRALQRCIDEG